MFSLGKIRLKTVLSAIISFSLAIVSASAIILADPELADPKLAKMNRYAIALLFTLSCLALIHVWVSEAKIPLFRFIKKCLIIFLPATIILSCGLYYRSRTVHFFTYLLTSLYFVALYVFALKKYLDFKKNDESRKSLKRTLGSPMAFLRKNSLESVLILAILAIFLGFGLSGLGKSASVDEPLWTFDRIPKFWNNVADGEIHKTMISDKPGITVALVSGSALNFVDPDEYELQRTGDVLRGPDKDLERFNFLFRFPLMLFNALMLLVFFALFLKISDKKSSFLFLIFAGLSPILLGISQIVNPDALLWIFLPLSIISYFIYLKNERSIPYLILAGFFMGLGLLTKYITNILAVYFLAIIFMEAILAGNDDRRRMNAFLRGMLIDYLMLLGTAIFVAFLLLPAAWKNPSRLFEITIWSEAFHKTWMPFFAAVAIICAETFFWNNRFIHPILRWLSAKKIWLIRSTGLLMVFFILSAMLNVYLGMQWFDFENIVASPKTSSAFNNFFGFLSANFYSIVFGIAPFILFFLLYALAKNVFSKKITEENKWMSYLSVFILAYYLASAISLVSATVRYQIVIFPISFMIAAFGAKMLLDDLRLRSSYPFIAISLVLVVLSIHSLDSIRPHYFSYASSLLPQEYVLNPKDMGDGSYEAAQYLNKLPDAEKLLVWTDKKGVCYFFTGRCSDTIELEEELKFDYYVISAGRENRIGKLSLTKGSRSKFPMDFSKLYSSEKTVFELSIGGRKNNYVRIISAEDISL